MNWPGLFNGEQMEAAFARAGLTAARLEPTLRTRGICIGTSGGRRGRGAPNILEAPGVPSIS